VGWAGPPDSGRSWCWVARFRTTVKVDSKKAAVDRGPYRYERHPSYTGLLIFAIGFGLELGN
jgi:protein-S-isoprenylcysteine O-methyltransferase Ste14